MTHNHKRAEWHKEGLYSLLCGILFGATNTIVGHPFDTIKTKMQA
jgi:solute carrier family 25 carnitine/acylcarnitine transporter 20/29